MNEERKNPLLNSPHFNHKLLGFRPEFLQEFLVSLLETNKKLVENANKYSGYFLNESIVMFMLDMSDKFDVNEEGTFLAIELFDKFMSALLKEIDEAYKKYPTKNWDQTIEKLKNQMLLRCLSCICLAIKISCSKSTLGCSRVRNILLELGYNFSLESIVNSELRILKYLEFKLNRPTPLYFMETLLEILGKNVPSLEPKVFYLIGTKIIECFYCYRKRIYEKLYEIFTESSISNASEENRKIFLSIENDYLYLASSIIVASAYIYDSEEGQTYKTVLEEIAIITKLDQHDLTEFSLVLCYFSLNGNK